MPYKILSDKFPGLTLFFSNVWPVGLGAATGNAVAQSAEWRYPWLAAVLSGAVLQLLIALLRNLFTERRDVLAALRDMLREQRESQQNRELNERRVRHELANRAHVAELKLYMVASGTPFDKLPHVKPLYDLDAEEVDIHQSRQADRRSGEFG